MKQDPKPSSPQPAVRKKIMPARNVAMADKSAGQLLEDLLGMLSNRKELIEKINKKFPRSNDGHKSFAQYQKQTTKFCNALLEERSAYGDGVGSPDPDNAYNDYWKGALKKWDTINKHRLIPFWRALESILKNIYKQLLSLMTVLPASFKKVLHEQLNELEEQK